MAGDVMTKGGVRMSGDLIGADDIQGLAGIRVDPGMDRPVRHDDRRLVVLQQCGERAHGGFVAGDDRDGAGEAGGFQMLAQRVVGDLTADQGVAHFPRAVANAVRGGAAAVDRAPGRCGS